MADGLGGREGVLDQVRAAQGLDEFRWQAQDLAGQGLRPGPRSGWPLRLQFPDQLAQVALRLLGIRLVPGLPEHRAHPAMLALGQVPEDVASLVFVMPMSA